MGPIHVVPEGKAVCAPKEPNLSASKAGYRTTMADWFLENGQYYVQALPM